MIVHCLLLLCFTAYCNAVAGGEPVSSLQSPEWRLGGANAKYGASHLQFPDVMSLTYTPSGSSETFIGQASIIAANMTITAASCFWDIKSDEMMNANQVKLYGGSLLKGPPVDPPTEDSPKQFDVKEIFIHPGFAFYPVSQVFEKDIALIVPEMNFTLKQLYPGPYLRAISLSLKKFNTSNALDGRFKGITPSWGKIDGGSGVVHTSEVTELKFIEYPFAKNADCVATYQSATLGAGAAVKSASYTVKSSSLCMNTTQGKGICKEDVGASVRVWQSGVPYIYGIASKIMTDTCPPKRPDLYSRVSYFRDWIRAKGGPKVV